MDSFYDAPRPPPAPITRETFTGIPVVPEISVLCSSNNVPTNAFTSYNQWKQQQNNFLGHNKENVNTCVQQPQNSSILKKQVRFENPVLQQKAPDIPKPPNVYRTNVHHKDDKQAPTFQQMYLANIPSRQLDLSVIDIPGKVPPKENKEALLPQTEPQIKEKETPKTYKEFMKSQKNATDIVLNDSVVDIFHYKNSPNNSKAKQKTIQHQNQTQPEKTIAEKNNIPSHVPSHPDTDIEYKNNVQQNYFERVTQAILQRQSPTPNKPQDYIQKQAPTSNDSFVSRNFPKNSNILSSPQSQSTDMPRYSQELPREKVPLSNIQSTNNNAPRFKENYNFIQSSSDNQLRKFDEANVKKYQEAAADTPNTCGCSSQSSKNPNNLAPRVNSDDDLTTKDLLKIIAQQSQQITHQNSQILLLQQQVTELVSMQKNNEIYRQRTIEMGHCCQHDSNSHQKRIPIEQPNEHFRNNGHVENCITSTQQEICNEVEDRFQANKNSNKNTQIPFSIGLTTSFEVSFRRPNNRVPNDMYPQKNPKLLNFESESPQIQEITETESTQSDRYDKHQVHNAMDNKETLVDTSMVFKEPIKVRESCPSPEPSIKINMNDFEESESDEDDSSLEEASFYRNLMSQVNKILQRAQIDTGEDFANMGSPKLNNKTIHKVKEATLKHLKRIGIDMPNFEEHSGNSSSSEDPNGRSYDQDDISFAVKQLLMKYLPADHLSKLAATVKEDAQLTTPKDKVGSIKNRPEFSFATVQYMKKYNLIANSQKDFKQPHKQTSKQSPKILDISKLKQQPKLL